MSNFNGCQNEMLTMLLAWVVGIAIAAAQDLRNLRKETAQHIKASGDMSELRMERDGLKAEMETWKSSSEKLEKQVEAIRKQAEGQAEEYMRLMSENSCLKSQLKDMDL